MKFTAQQIATFLQGEVVGDPNISVGEFAKIEEGREGCLSFLANPKYEEYIYTTQSSIVLVNTDFEPSKEVNATLIKVENAYASLAQLLQLAESVKPKKTGISSLAYISSSAKIGENAYIAPYVYIGENTIIGDNAFIETHSFVGDNARIGDNAILGVGVKIMHSCVIGNHFTAQPGAIVGADGFGFAPSNGVYAKIPQVGNVVVEDYVEIGCNTTIDRATMGSTVIRKGTKLDNLIQVAHNVEIGENCVFAAQVGIAGSTKVGNNCMFGGQVGIAGHLHIGDNVKLGAQSGVMHNVPSGETWLGYPAQKSGTFMRGHASTMRLPELMKTVQTLQKELNVLKQRLEEKES